MEIKDVTLEKPLSVGSFGFYIVIECGVEFYPDSNPELIIKKKSGIVIIKDAECQDSENGVVQYKFVPGDLSESGTYEFQVRQILPNGTSEFRSAIFELPVFKSLDIGCNRIK